MSFLKVQKEIKEGKLAPVYLIYGTELFLIEETIQSIINRVLTTDQYDFNLSVFDLRETVLSVAIEEALTVPFMGSVRVVIIREPQFLTAKDQGKLEHDLKAFEHYVANPVAETILLVVAPYEKLDERKKLVKLLKKQAEVVEAAPFGEHELGKWLSGIAKEFHVELNSGGKELLIQLLGNHLALIAGEMGKLALYVGEGGLIDEAAVKALVAKTIEQDVFSLINHIVQRRKKAALELFYELIRQKEEPLKIMALLARQFRIFYQVKELAKRGYSQQEIAAALKVHPYVVKLSNQQAGSFTEVELLKFLDELAETDFKIKTGKIDKQLGLELFIIKILTGFEHRQRQ